MSDYISAMTAVMQKEIDSLSVIAQNNANVNTIGYRRQVSAVDGQSFIGQLKVGANNVAIKTYLSNKDGPLKITNKILDLTVMGEGWFGVNHPSGILITRNGHFSISNDGILLHSSGYPVVGVGGDVKIGDSSDVIVNAEGEIQNEKGFVGQIQIFYKPSNADVLAVGDGLYKTSILRPAESGYKIIQGALEGANVDTAADMVHLMQTTRHIESLQRAMSTYDGLMETGIGQIGK